MSTKEYNAALRARKSLAQSTAAEVSMRAWGQAWCAAAAGRPCGPLEVVREAPGKGASRSPVLLLKLFLRDSRARTIVLSLPPQQILGFLRASNLLGSPELLARGHAAAGGEVVEMSAEEFVKAFPMLAELPG